MITGSLTRWIAVSAIALPALGCGSNAPEIPDELRGGSSGYGSEPGQTAENFCFEGWQNPEAVGFTGELESICFYDWHDPQGTKGFELLLVNTSALWCQACRVEHQTLADELAPRAPRGLGLVSLLFEDGKQDPATVEHLGIWTGQYDVTFPMALDPQYLMGRYAGRETAPLNMLLDARSMRIIQKTTGNEASVIWPGIDQELTSRGR